MQLSTNWATGEGDLAAVAQGTSSAHVTLKKLGEDAGPCTITCTFQQPVVRDVHAGMDKPSLCWVHTEYEIASCRSALSCCWQAMPGWWRCQCSGRATAHCHTYRLCAVNLKGAHYKAPSVCRHVCSLGFSHTSCCRSPGLDHTVQLGRIDAVCSQAAREFKLHGLNCSQGS